MSPTRLSSKTLDFDLTKEVDRIGEWMRNTLANTLHKRGVVLGLSGGVDSSVCGALAVRALGPARVFGILMPEHDSSATSADRGEIVARQLGIEFRLEHIGETLRAKAGPRIRRMEEGFRADALSYLLVLRLIPLFPFWLVNIVPAFLGVPVRTYVLGTFIGIIPGSFVYASVGNGLGAVFEAGGTPDLGIVFTPAILLPIVGLAVLALLPVAYRKYRARRKE